MGAGGSVGKGSSSLLSLLGGRGLEAQMPPSKVKSLVMKPSTLTMIWAGKVCPCGKVQERMPAFEEGTLHVLGRPPMVTSKSRPLMSAALGSMGKLI